MQPFWSIRCALQVGIPKDDQLVRAMIITACCNIKIIFFSKPKHFFDQLRCKAGIKGFYAFEPKRKQMLKPRIHIFANDELFAIPIRRMGKYRNAAAFQDPFDCFFRTYIKKSSRCTPI